MKIKKVYRFEDNKKILNEKINVVYLIKSSYNIIQKSKIANQSNKFS